MLLCVFLEQTVSEEPALTYFTHHMHLKIYLFLYNWMIYIIWNGFNSCTYYFLGKIQFHPSIILCYGKGFLTKWLFSQDEILYKFASGILYFNVDTHFNPKQVFPEQENIHEDSGWLICLIITYIASTYYIHIVMYIVCNWVNCVSSLWHCYTKKRDVAL